MENKLYIIYMPRLAATLRAMGFPIIKTTINNKKPQYDVYWFEDTPDFREAIPLAVKKVKG